MNEANVARIILTACKDFARLVRLGVLRARPVRLVSSGT